MGRERGILGVFGAADQLRARIEPGTAGSVARDRLCDLLMGPAAAAPPMVERERLLMDEMIDALEATLLKNPFDIGTRQRYAARLLIVGKAQEALHQFELCAQQAPTIAAPHIGAAKCLAAIGDLDAARSRYEEARKKDAFVEDTELATRLG